jgi:DNA-binding GntR family transcriptional regulator
MPLPATVDRLDREPSREIIYRRLKGLILDLTLQPLEVLRDVDLARQLGVSRTPVREALRKLEDEGLVESQRNQWTRVCAVVPRHLLEIYPIAQALHVTALRLAFKRLGREDLEALRDANAAMSDAIARRRPAAALRADAAFHRVIVERAGNPILTQLVTWLTEKLQRIELAYFGQVESGSASVDEHRALLRAIRAGDLNEAVKQLGTNWECPIVTDEPSGEAG